MEAGAGLASFSSTHRRVGNAGEGYFPTAGALSRRQSRPCHKLSSVLKLTGIRHFRNQRRRHYRTHSGDGGQQLLLKLL
jgi:hypothetical protein